MSEIPDDIMEAAEAVFRGVRHAIVTYVDPYEAVVVAARAILAERDRCTNIVERHEGTITHRQHMADLIRRGRAIDPSGTVVQSDRAPTYDIGFGDN